MTNAADPSAEMQHQPPVIKQDISEARGPSGINGWLFFLILGLVVVAPLWAWGMTTQTFEETEKAHPALLRHPNWETYKSASWIVVGVCAVAGVAAGLLLARKRTRGSVTFAKTALLLRGPVATIVQFLLAGMLVPVFTAESIGQAVGQFAGSCFATGIWIVYLSRSKRVRNTYYKPELTSLTQAAS